MGSFHSITATRFWITAVLTTGLTLVLVPSAHGDDAHDVANDWDPTGISTEAWNPAPGGGGYWTNIDLPAAADPYIYKYVMACSENRPGTPRSCIAGERECTEAKGGRAVDWYRSLKPPSRQVWTLVSKATCIYTEKPRDILAEIAAQISHEFQKTPVQPATVGSQPGPHTLR
ncbi:hypothetical protein MMF96_19275, partial [Arthrobacter sp. STN4]|nr:hypothetical protein [Arthrobacter sp. STN4]